MRRIGSELTLDRKSLLQTIQSMVHRSHERPDLERRGNDQRNQPRDVEDKFSKQRTDQNVVVGSASYGHPKRSHAAIEVYREAKVIPPNRAEAPQPKIRRTIARHRQAGHEVASVRTRRGDYQPFGAAHGVEKCSRSIERIEPVRKI